MFLFGWFFIITVDIKKIEGDIHKMTTPKHRIEVQAEKPHKDGQDMHSESNRVLMSDVNVSVSRDGDVQVVPPQIEKVEHSESQIQHSYSDDELSRQFIEALEALQDENIHLKDEVGMLKSRIAEEDARFSATIEHYKEDVYRLTEGFAPIKKIIEENASCKEELFTTKKQLEASTEKLSRLKVMYKEIEQDVEEMINKTMSERKEMQIVVSKTRIADLYIIENEENNEQQLFEEFLRGYHTTEVPPDSQLLENQFKQLLESRKQLEERCRHREKQLAEVTSKYSALFTFLCNRLNI